MNYDTNNVFQIPETIDFILTGSRIYGPFRAHSDLDIVIHIEDVEKVEAELTKHGIDFTISNAAYTDSSRYFTFLGITFNMIIAKENEFHAWRYATAQVHKYSSIFGPIEDRVERVELFQKYYNSKL